MKQLIGYKTLGALPDVARGTVGTPDSTDKGVYVFETMCDSRWKTRRYPVETVLGNSCWFEPVYEEFPPHFKITDLRVLLPYVGQAIRYVGGCNPKTSICMFEGIDLGANLIKVSGFWVKATLWGIMGQELYIRS